MMASTSTLSVAYSLSPPSLSDSSDARGSEITSTEIEGPAPKSHTLTYNITASPPSMNSSNTGSYAAYYASASTTVLQAQKELNEYLTIWKDAIGDKEKHKEDPGKVGYGKGKAARMMNYAKKDGAASTEAGAIQGEEEEEDEEDEDGPGQE